MQCAGDDPQHRAHVCEISPVNSGQRGSTKKKYRQAASIEDDRVPDHRKPAAHAPPRLLRRSGGDRLVMPDTPDQVRRMRDLNPRGLLTQPAFQASAIGH